MASSHCAHHAVSSTELKQSQRKHTGGFSAHPPLFSNLPRPSPACSLLLAALAALACGAMAGPYQAGAGCYNTDTVKSYPIEGFNFRDFAKVGPRGRWSYVDDMSGAPSWPGRGQLGRERRVPRTS